VLIWDDSRVVSYSEKVNMGLSVSELHDRELEDGLLPERSVRGLGFAEQEPNRAITEYLLFVDSAYMGGYVFAGNILK